ncbi:MAG: asparagine synthase (glutamine-hydrolyzing) [Pseudodesulfovibrio sp.]
MCGILGIVDKEGGSAREAVLQPMLDAIHHRGPDGQGTYEEGPVAMGMRRLSIIDIDGGRQPFFSRGGRVIAFQNGEIYNFKALRRELEERGYTFTSTCDTEVLAHGYDAWGIRGLLNRLDGMFALAILDRDESALYIARDRFGEKPLYYAHSGNRFAYSSTLATVVAHGWVNGDIDTLSLHRYLSLHYVPGDRTIFLGVSKLLPGQALRLGIDSMRLDTFLYYIPFLAAEPHAPSEKRLSELLDESIVTRLAADVPVGVFLSGGVDSSLVAAMSARHHSGINTFSIGFDSAGHDESQYAKAVAKHIGSRHHHFIFDQDRFNDLLPQVAAYLDEPLGDQACLPTYWLCQEARKVVTVALSGEAADEVFGGYSYYDVPAASRPGSLLGEPGNATSISGFPLLLDVTQSKALADHRGGSEDEWEAGLAGWLNTAADPVMKSMAADLTTWLPDNLLVKLDRMCMAHSLEGRAPYLNREIVEYGLNLRPSGKISENVFKVTLRKVAEPLLPKGIFDRPKQGFVLPMEKWLASWFEEYGSPKYYFAQAGIPHLDTKSLGIFCEDQQRMGMPNQRAVFSAIMLCEWYTAFSRKTAQLRDAVA